MEEMGEELENNIILCQEITPKAKRIYTYKKCKKDDCMTVPVYNKPSETVGIYCKLHADDDMVDVVSKFCIFTGCGIQAVFNKPGETVGIYCKTHAADDMIDVKSKKCAKPDCNTRPVFNMPNETVGIYCKKHAETGMIDVISKKCIKPGCNIRPVFNKPGEPDGIYCKKHADDDMIDVKSKKCAKSGCNTRPVFNKPDETEGLYCKDHAEDDMVDVKSKKCEHESGCKIQASYNFKTEKQAKFCGKHKATTMVVIKGNYCIEYDCYKNACFNKDGMKNAIYCLAHKKDDMINVVHLKCKTLMCITRANPKYENYCIRCFVYLFPDKPVTRNYKTKERTITEYILEQFPIETHSWIIDRRVQDGCSKRRPDLLLDLGYQIIIIEVDENQHIDYDCSCENKRIMEISKDLNHRPIVFIRFNPDGYIDKNGKKILSCWSLNRYNIYCVKLNCQKKWKSRLDALCDQIKYWSDIQNKTDKMIETVHLFYDES